MFKEMLEKIKEYNTIVIYRHTSPDFDAFGSQFGLYDIIQFTYPNKQVYVAGDFSSDLVSKYDFMVDGQLPDFSKEEVLGIVLDTANYQRIDGESYTLCKEIIKVDHHIVVDSYGTMNIEDTTASSCSQMIGEFYQENQSELELSVGGASAIYLGIIGDTNRFLFKSTSSKTLIIAAMLMEHGIDISQLYKSIYLRKESDLKVNAFILNNYQVHQGIAYYILKEEDLQQLQITREQGSNYVNLLSNIEEYEIWMAVTQNTEKNNWRVSIRSRDVVINTVAEKYNGGGHALASGATLETLDQLPVLLKDIEEKINE